MVVSDTRREITRSILALVVTTFFGAANHRPRADRNGRSRVQIHDDVATPEQIDEACTALNETARRQELARGTLEAGQTPEVRTYLDEAFARLGLDDPERSMRIAISRYPPDAIVDGVAIRSNPTAGARLEAFAERACELAAMLDHRFWLLGIVDTMRAQPPPTHAALVQLVSRRSHCTYRIRGEQMRDAVHFIVGRVMPLH